MAYTPKNWVNRQVERPNTYNLQNNTDGSVTLLPAEGVIIEEGTPLEATSMNVLENGLAEVSTTVGNGINDYVRQPAFASTSGTSTAYLVSLNPAPTAILDGFGITIVPNVTNGTNATLNINGLGAFPLKKQNGVIYQAGKLVAGKPYTFRKVGTDFLADSTGGNGDALVSDVRAGKKFTNDESDDLTGSLTVRATGVTTITPGPSTQSLLPGIYDNTIAINGVSVPAAKVLNDTEIAGTKGTMVKRGSTEGAVSTTWDGNNMFVRIPQGGYTQLTGVGYPEIVLSPAQARADANITKDNIRNGVWMYGIQGNLQPATFSQVNVTAPHDRTTNLVTTTLLTFPAGLKYAILMGGQGGGFYNRAIGNSSNSTYTYQVYLQDSLGQILYLVNMVNTTNSLSQADGGGIILNVPANTFKFPRQSAYQSGWETGYDINPETGVFTKPFNFAGGFSLMLAFKPGWGNDDGSYANLKGEMLWG